MRPYAIRGAITAETNEVDSILNATKEMLKSIIDNNNLKFDDIVSMFFTTTKDLNAVFPARAARELGITNSALMCAHEMEVPNALPMCIRVMIHVFCENGFKPNHCYLRGAKILRPDLTQI